MRGGRAWTVVLGVVLLAALPLASRTGAAPGEEPLALSPVTQQVDSFDVTADGTTVVFVTRSGLGLQMLSAPIDGGPMVPVTALEPGELFWSAGSVGTTVVISKDGDLLVGPADGTPLTNLTETFEPAVRFDPRQVPGGSHVVFQARGQTGGDRLYSARIDGGQPVDLTDHTAQSVTQWASTPDGLSVVYSVRGQFAGVDLFIRDIDGAAEARSLVSGVLGDWQLSPDGLHVVWATGDSAATLRSVPVAGGDTASLGDTLQFGTLENFTISEDSSRVVFQYFSGLRRVYSAPIEGGLPVLEAVPPGSGVMDTSYAVSADGQWLAFSGSTEPGIGSRAFTTRLGSASGDVVEHTGGLTGGSVIQLAFTPDSATVVFSYFRPGASDEVWSAPVAGGSPTLISEGYPGATMMPQDHNASGLQLSPDGRHALYRTNPAIGGEHLMWAPIAGGEPISLFSTRAMMGYFDRPMITPDGNHLLVATTTSLPGQPQFNRVVAIDLTPDPPSAELRVTTVPPLPASIVVDGVQRNRWGLTWAELGPGFRRVCFGTVPGWTAPPCTDLAVGGVTEVQGTYTERGSLRVVTEPPVPSTISVDGVPRNDWGMWLDIDPGQYDVCFGDIAGFAAPPCQVVSVNAGELSTVTGTFAADGSEGPVGDGFLRVTTNPPVAARIIVDGVARDRWGLAWMKLAQGVHDVCFDEAPGFRPPPCQNVVVVAGSTATVVGEMEELGQLRVMTSPPAPGTIHVDGIARDDWGVWFDIPSGSHEVCFQRVSGQQPDCETAVIDQGALTTIEGDYANPSP